MSRSAPKLSQYKANELFKKGLVLAFSKKIKRRNHKKVFQLWLEAAESGHVRAQFYTGTCYDFGKGTPVNRTLALYWYLKAARAGHRDSQYNVGFFYGHGVLGKTDHRKMVFWYTKAANAGLFDAQRDLGYSYFYGEGVKQSDEQAVYWYKKLPVKTIAKQCIILGYVIYMVMV
ncbi:MAG: sel1 repeat family protein [Bacteroidetes bacterium]|nr:sel1 repeat family protein [Bacteroidota bacterium]